MKMNKADIEAIAVAGGADDAERIAMLEEQVGALKVMLMEIVEEGEASEASLAEASNLLNDYSYGYDSLMKRPKETLEALGVDLSGLGLEPAKEAAAEAALEENVAQQAADLVDDAGAMDVEQFLAEVAQLREVLGIEEFPSIEKTNGWANLLSVLIEAEIGPEAAEQVAMAYEGELAKTLAGLAGVPEEPPAVVVEEPPAGAARMPKMAEIVAQKLG